LNKLRDDDDGEQTLSDFQLIHLKYAIVTRHLCQRIQHWLIVSASYL